MGGSTQFFTGIILNDGTCAMAGSNSNNQQSNGQSNDPVGFNYTTNIDTETNLNNVTCVSLGALHSGVVFNNGNVAMNGDNTYGQLGIGPNNLLPVSEATRLMLNTDGVTILSNASTVSCGNGFTLVLLKNGNVLSCGLNTSGQLGVNNNVNYSVPQYVINNTQTDNLSNIIAISAGDSFSAFLTNSGNVLTCGLNNYGQLGNGIVSSNRSYPDYVIDINQNPISGVIAISCGYQHMAMLLNTGNVLVCGNNSNGQCGNYQLHNSLQYLTFFVYPVFVNYNYSGAYLTNIKSVSCGKLNTYFITNNGLLLGTGDNTYGQLSTLNYTSSLIPINMLNSNGDLFDNAVSVSGSNNFVTVLKQDGTAYFAGNNYNNNFTPITLNNSITINSLVSMYIDNYYDYYGLTLLTNVVGLSDAYTINLPCFLENTKILCLVNDKETYVSIQYIRSGMHVKTLTSGYVPVAYIGKRQIQNPSHNYRIKERLYRCSQEFYPEITEDLFITGCHSILVDELTTEQREKTIELLGEIYETEDKYRLMACLDDRAEPFLEEGEHTIYHIALENENNYYNYGIYANGLLVESCSIRYITELSGMKIIE